MDNSTNSQLTYRRHYVHENGCWCPSYFFSSKFCFSPHIHLLLLVPEAKKKVFLKGISKDMARRDKRGYFRLVADDIETSSQVKSWSKLVRYVSGQFRHNPPVVLWVNGQSARAANNPKHWDDLRTIRESRTADGALVSSVLPELPDIQTERVSQ